MTVNSRSNINIDDISICVFNEDGKYLYMSDTFFKIRNVPRSFYTTLTPYDLLENHLIDKCIIEEVKKKGEPVSDIQNIMNDEGILIKKQLVTIYPVYDENKKLKYYIGYYKNLTKNNYISTYKQNIDLNQKLNDKIIAKSSVIKNLYFYSSLIAKNDANVLITGETGTGKEILARFIHNNSDRFNKKLTLVDCASLSLSLIEAELFGYIKGSFTGANNNKIGLIESSNGGTLFLDEINSLPLEIQGKLLRVIETKVIRRIGSIEPVKVDFRLIAATNSDLLNEVSKGNFRSDLYYRLNVIPLNIPPLRDRKEDIIPLAKHFESIFRDKYNIEGEFKDDFFQKLSSKKWLGNIRELKNYIERCVIMSQTDMSEMLDSINMNIHKINKDNICESNINKSTSILKMANPEEEKQIIIKALEINNNHRQKTANFLKISRRTLQYKLKKYNLL